jgi:hypothetical protein
MHQIERCAVCGKRTRKQYSCSRALPHHDRGFDVIAMNFQCCSTCEDTEEMQDFLNWYFDESVKQMQKTMRSGRYVSKVDGSTWRLETKGLET